MNKEFLKKILKELVPIIHAGWEEMSSHSMRVGIFDNEKTQKEIVQPYINLKEKFKNFFPSNEKEKEIKEEALREEDETLRIYSQATWLFHKVSQYLKESGESLEKFF
jgi:hypothetical protein